MAERYEIDHSGRIVVGESALCSNIDQTLINLFSQFGWTCDLIDKTGACRIIELKDSNDNIKQYNVYCGTIRNEARNPYEKKIQLGTASDPKTKSKNNTIILGIYVYNAADSLKDAIFVGYPIDDDIRYETNPSIRGTFINKILIQAKNDGFVYDEEHNSVAFRSEFAFYYLSNYYDIHYNHKITRYMADVVYESESKKSNTTSSVKYADNIILYGVPGCGKSHKIKTEYCDDEKFMERVVFHPDYTYSDFIGQILPENVNGHISYPFVPGPFTRVLTKAEVDPDNYYYLIIEELNRGNAPAIFGEVFQLLDRIDGVSEYGINNADIALKVYGDANHQVRLPKNLFILATMNTADQNVFTLDTAFQRRWRMRGITNDISKCIFGDNLICGSNVSWKSFLDTINDKIIELGEGSISSEDKRLGAYFVQQNELADIDVFSEKVLMYLWNDAFKYDHDKVFKSQYKTLEQLICGFKSTLFGIFNDNIVFSVDCIDTVYDPSDDDSTSTGSSTAIWVPCSDFVKSWVEGKKQQPNSIISSVLIKRGVTYKRFTTKLFDSLIPVSTSNTSGWNTANHYFYEIVLKTNKLYVQFVCNVNSNTPQNILDAFENTIFPVTKRKLSEGLQWYCNRICDALPLTPDIEKEKVTEYLEKCYDKMVEFEKAFSADTTVNG